MAVFTRVNGTAEAVVHVDIADRPLQASTGIIISTGIGKHPTMFRVDSDADLRGETGVGGKVEYTLYLLEFTPSIVVKNPKSCNVASFGIGLTPGVTLPTKSIPPPNVET